MTPPSLEGTSTGATAPWTWRRGTGWAVRSQACPCRAPAPQRRTTLWTTSTSTSDSPAVWGDTKLWLTGTFVLHNLFFLVIESKTVRFTPPYWHWCILFCVSVQMLFQSLQSRHDLHYSRPLQREWISYFLLFPVNIKNTQTTVCK